MINIVFLSLLIGLYPSIFFISNNYFVFTFGQKLFLALGAPLLSLVILTAYSSLQSNHKIAIRNKSFF